jgi:hypothetical protein
MLSTSTRGEKTNKFLEYVRKNYKEKLLEIATSIDNKYTKCRLWASQILEYYEIVPLEIRQKYYVSSLIDCIRNCDEVTYSGTLNHLIHNIKTNRPTILKIRTLLVRIIESDNPTNIRKRCQDLLEIYK